MKVLLLTHHFAPTTGGIESYTLGLAKALKENGIDCRVVCLNKEPRTGKKLAKEETIEGIEVKRVSFLDFGFYKIAFGLLGEIKKADLVHVQNIGFLSDFSILTKPLHKKPVVISTHGGISHTKNRAFLKNIYWKWLGFLLKKADFLIADSIHDFQRFENAAKTIRTIENGVELEKFFALERRPRKDSFVFVGRISKNKRVDLLLEAFSLVLEQKPEATLKIIGNDFDNILKSLQDKAIELEISNRVFFWDSVSKTELLHVLSESEFFVSASEFEGFGIAVIEAMAAGCIPLLNNIDAFRIFISDKKNGFLVEFSKPERAARTIAQTMNQNAFEKARLSREAHASAEKYSWKKVVSEIIEAYKGVLE